MSKKNFRILVKNGIKKEMLSMEKRIERLKNFQSALDNAIQTIIADGRQPRIIIMPSGSLTIPLIQK